MRGFLTRGQPAATEAVAAMLAAGVPHALLLAGPTGVGKTTLALDLAAGLLCANPDRAIRPCRSCRACRALEHGNHPDLHRLAPVGPGAIIPIGGGDQRGVRDLIGELALMPVEGGARVAIVEAAERMTEDAQSALLKTLEEPPAGTVLLLCAEDDERLLPTIRSRCVRIRLGPVPTRAIEEILVEAGVADAPMAARLGRLSGGRPGAAMALSVAPDAVRLRDEIARTLLDLLDATRTGRLTGVRDLATRAAELVRAMQPDRPATAGRGRSSAAAPADPGNDAAAPDAESNATATATRAPAAERRAAALALIAVWRDVVRDAALVGLRAPGRIREPELLEDLEAARAWLTPERAGSQLRALDVAGERLEGNVSPELVLDGLALAWGA
ncbi:MAG TPA: DNA polymerase III subunit [Candidatus Limnocylindrales bacterium]|nr:DNA polymerase III subunit [Candidatus Limnocylindrales bacterium]